ECHVTTPSLATMRSAAAGVPGLEALLQREWETPKGWRGSLSTVDHKIIGKRYLITAFLFLIIGGLEAGAMRIQLSRPDNHLLSAEQYNQLFTVHGVTMIFLYAAPILSGFSNYLWPLMLGSRDMAFPRLNALSYWIYVGAGLLLYSSVLIGAMPNAGWFNYPPFSARSYDPGLNIDFYLLGLTLLTISTTVGSANFVVSLLKTRAPGMSVNRLPIIVWGTLTASMSNLLALPSLTVACVFLFLDRRFGTHFFDPAGGGHPLLWQHLFWMFGHPWVYVIVLPAMGMVSDILPTFCRRPLVGYLFVACATLVTGVLGFGVWLHHMFATGIPPLGMSFFAGASIVIAIPSGVGVFSWLATIWLGRPRLTASFLYMAGFVVLFTIGGVTGVMTAAVPFDLQLTDTYFVVAHLHYVLVGINVFPVIGAVYYWFPKMTGKLMNERIGKWGFWISFVGTNLVFFPMHLVGMLGMPRRIYTYAAGMGWGPLNMLETVGAFVLALGILLFLINVLMSARNGAPSGPNPWDAPTLEWATSSPPPPYNFSVIPTIASRHPLWEDRLQESAGRSTFANGLILSDKRETVGTTVLDAEPSVVLRMPGDSFVPLALASTLTLTFFSLLASSTWLTAIGVLGVATSVLMWLWPNIAVADVSQPTRNGSLVVEGSGVQSVAWWGMMCVLVTEGAFFGYLLVAYFYLAASSTNAFPTKGPPELPLVLVNTVLLLFSSGTLEMAKRAVKRAQHRRAAIATACTIALGVLFLDLQIVEYTKKTIRPTDDAYASLFFTITGFHGLHVLVGVIMLVVMLTRILRKHFTPAHHTAVTNIAMYWHFVDAVWLVVFTSLYLSPRL
ncbi:MAG: cytochrome c oxidase subunit I, partial [Gemmatimonadaceae bacterium]